MVIGIRKLFCPGGLGSIDLLKQDEKPRAIMKIFYRLIEVKIILYTYMATPKTLIHKLYIKK